MSEMGSAEALHSSMPSSDSFETSPGSSYGYFLGVEKTPHNVIFGNAIVVSLFLQPIIFYATWTICPSLTKNRRGLSWILTFFSAVILLSLTLCELGHMRITLWSLLGWEVQGPEAASATIFTYWIPSFHNWINRLGSDSGSSSAVTLSTLPSSLSNQSFLKQLLLRPQTYKDLTREYLQWFISLPIFSLAPLKPTQLYSLNAPYYLGGGGRILFSLENFPRESWFSSVIGGYFIAYCIGDLLIGQLHYREHIDPASGWIHHLVYSGLVYVLATQHSLSSFLIAGGLLEVSTIFLGSGMMFPQLREDFWFPLSFFLARIVFVAFMLQEVTFNYPGPRGGSFIYFLALLMHINWFIRYWKGRQRRMRKVVIQEWEDKEYERSTSSTTSGGESTSTSVSIAKTTTTFQLRVKKDKS